MQVAVGVVGVALAWGLAGAQWWRARRSVAGISALSWATFLAVNLSWLVYALGTGNPYLVANSIGAAAFNVALLRRIDHGWPRTAALVAACVTTTAALGLAVGWPSVAIACFALALTVRLPQIAEALRALDLSGVSITSWALAVANNTIWTVISVQRHDWWFAGANIGLATTTVILIMVVQFRRARLARR